MFSPLRFCRDLFDGSVGVRQPDFVDIMQNILARLMVVLAVALQDFVTARRVFERHERNIRAVLCADRNIKSDTSPSSILMTIKPFSERRGYAFCSLSDIYPR